MEFFYLVFDNRWYIFRKEVLPIYSYNDFLYSHWTEFNDNMVYPNNILPAQLKTIGKSLCVLFYIFHVELFHRLLFNTDDIYDF